MRIAAFTALGIFALDQISKLIVFRGMNLLERGEIEVWPPFIMFRMAWNRGINFGLFSGDGDVTRWVLISVALAISVWVWTWIKREGASVPAQISAGLLIGGAVGNVVDRVVYGAVADFLNITCCGIENPYAFNLADIAVFAGAFGLMLFSGRNADGKTKGSKTP